MSKKSPSVKRKIVQAGGWQVAKRVAKSIPYVGSVLAIGLVGYNIKKKGVVNGLVDSGLDAIPIVGTVKNVTEFFTGDFIPEKEEKVIEGKIEELGEQTEANHSAHQQAKLKEKLSEQQIIKDH